MLDLSLLNRAQREAVLTCEGPLLVLAGAGTGKTRTLTYRIAHLIEDEHVSPHNILAVTFTNKAAREMRQRVTELLGSYLSGMWVCTFHSMCVRILRPHASLLGFSPEFTIYDTDDSTRLIKNIIAESQFGAQNISASVFRAKISSLKNNLVLSTESSSASGGFFDDIVSKVYDEYQARLMRANAMDFDDLLVNTYELFSKNPELKDEYAQRFLYIMIDEYQDTNHVQYALVQMLAKYHGNLMVVGDDDQSIYSWRGADLRNILEFEKDWSQAHLVKLEQNYRSTEKILAAANALIAHNNSRKPKHLYTEGASGKKIALYMAADEADEGRWIASEIEKLHDQGASYAEIAVFYRIGALSRVLEDMFLRAGVPYHMVGGIRFFERSEIRDLTAYLKLIVNPADDISARRVINIPRRKIGKVTIERIQARQRKANTSFLAAARLEADDCSGKSATRKALKAFLAIIDEARSFEGSLLDVVQMIIDKTGLLTFFEAQENPEAQSRIENIREFVGVVHDFCEAHPYILDDEDAAGSPVFMSDKANGTSDSIPDGAHAPTLADFMEWLSLRSDLDTLEADAGGAVTFMTIHSAKGLEYNYVFVAGMEQTLFPYAKTVEEGGLEEERRLAYVAITRAKKQLYFTYAKRRRIFNTLRHGAASCFIKEIPDELMRRVGIGSLGIKGLGWEKRGDRHSTYGFGRGSAMYGGHIFDAKNNASATASTKAVSPDLTLENFAPGDLIDHKTFGKGRVICVEGDKLKVRFSATGKEKTLLKGYAPIVKIKR